MYSSSGSDGLNKWTPPRLKLLATFFYALEFAMHALELYQQKTLFSSLKRSIEDSCKRYGIPTTSRLLTRQWRTFTIDHLKQIYSIIPEAYCLYMERCGNPSKCTENLIIKRKSIGMGDGENSSRIDLFNLRVNHIVSERLTHLREQNIDEEFLEDAMNEFEIQHGQLPIMRDTMCKSITSASKPSTLQNSEDLDEELARVLARPVPQTLKSLPTWLINKVTISIVSYAFLTRLTRAYRFGKRKFLTV